ncbi:hypothetical protein GIB67_032849 [Kingdonia uniflora]|uniref:Uncharacterized protein n=1 Tax=Kingdonia uniflora TaxID=39325 RepID=A0A7J7NBK0_9MAGN|nr:hypothetical protein GIB67_032849 [Kingdonia uniflora]
MSTVGDSTLPLGDTPLLGQYQFSTPEKTTKHKREGDLQQATPGEGLEVVKDLMVDDDVKVNLEAISSEYDGSLLKKGDEKDNKDEKDDDDEKDVEEKVTSEEKQPQVAEEKDSKPLTVVVCYNGKKYYGGCRVQTMMVAEVAKTDIVFFNQKEVVGNAYQASSDQTAVFVYLQTKESKKEVEYNKEEVVEGKDDDGKNLRYKQDPEQLVLMESEVDITLKKRHALTDEEINERAIKMVCEMNQLHSHLDELHPGVLLESFIQRPISQDKINQVDQVWSLRKDELSLESKNDNMSTYMRIGEETVCLNALYTLYPKQWLDNEVINV